MSSRGCDCRACRGPEPTVVSNLRYPLFSVVNPSTLYTCVYVIEKVLGQIGRILLLFSIKRFPKLFECFDGKPLVLIAVINSLFKEIRGNPLFGLVSKSTSFEERISDHTWLPSGMAGVIAAVNISRLSIKIRTRLSSLFGAIDEDLVSSKVIALMLVAMSIETSASPLTALGT